MILMELAVSKLEDVIRLASAARARVTANKGPAWSTKCLDEMIDSAIEVATDPDLGALRRLLDGLDWAERIEIKALVYVGRGDFTSFMDAKLEAVEDLEAESDVDHLADMAPLATYLLRGAAKLNIALFAARHAVPNEADPVAPSAIANVQR